MGRLVDSTAVTVAALLALIVPVNAHVYVVVNVPDQVHTKYHWMRVFVTAASLDREWAGGNAASVIPIAVQGKLDKLTQNLMSEVGPSSVVLTYKYPATHPGWERLPDDLEAACVRLVEVAMNSGVPVKFLLCLDSDAGFIPGLELAPIVAKQQGAVVWGNPLTYMTHFDVPVLTLDEYLRNPEYDFSDLSIRALAVVQPLAKPEGPYKSQPFDPITLAAVQFACMRPALVAFVTVGGSLNVDTLKQDVRDRFLSAYGKELKGLDDVEYVVSFGSVLLGSPKFDVGVACFPFHGLPGFLAANRMLVSMHLHGEASPLVVFDPTGSLSAYYGDIQHSVTVKWLSVPDVNSLNLKNQKFAAGIVVFKEALGQNFLQSLNSECNSFLFICADPNSIAQRVDVYATPNGFPKFRAVIAFRDPAGAIMAYLFAASGVELGRAVVWACWELEQLRGYVDVSPGYLLVGDPFYRFEGPFEYPLPNLPEGKDLNVKLPRAFLVPADKYRLVPLIFPAFVTGLTKIPKDPYSTVLADGLNFVAKRLGPNRYSVSGILIHPSGIRNAYVLPLNESDKYHVTVTLELVTPQPSPPASWRKVPGVSVCGIAVTLASLLVVSGATRARARSWRTSRSRTSRRS
ncbi:hypothetical protein [Methanopyrus kandleri]|uniref:Uncharacterized protein n=2 Tax=Methanopyrus kandleri TaxID=2320 RepID=Q8TYQ6_METKA|nr:hypothetical protein [Methanopyrus kandleri]AAM01453.1 Uncharacterized protein MK0236 [Methanopyrus kandleri AV19]HII70621.1 hypothetical protein [Methanopyrus kandleri]